MNKLKKTMLCLLAMTAAFSVSAQTVTEEPADFMHSNGKIYVVVAIVLTILVGMFVYLIRLDRKISSLEKK